jgi:hypothetical protein
MPHRHTLWSGGTTKRGRTDAVCMHELVAVRAVPTRAALQPHHLPRQPGDALAAGLRLLRPRPQAAPAEPGAGRADVRGGGADERDDRARGAGGSAGHLVRHRLPHQRQGPRRGGGHRLTGGALPGVAVPAHRLVPDLLAARPGRCAARTHLDHRTVTVHPERDPDDHRQLHRHDRTR